MKMLFVVGFTLFIASCGGDTNTISGSSSSSLKNISSTSFTDLVDRVSKTQIQDAVECGTVAFDESQIAVNTCVYESFMNGLEARAFYQHSDVIVTSASAIAVHTDGKLYFWNYNNVDLGQYDASQPPIFRIECSAPELTGVIANDHLNLFSCTQDD